MTVPIPSIRDHPKIWWLLLVKTVFLEACFKFVLLILIHHTTKLHPIPHFAEPLQVYRSELVWDTETEVFWNTQLMCCPFLQLLNVFIGAEKSVLPEAVGVSQCSPVPVPPETDWSALDPMTVAKVGRYKHLYKSKEEPIIRKKIIPEGHQ